MTGPHKRDVAEMTLTGHSPEQPVSALPKGNTGDLTLKSVTD